MDVIPANLSDQLVPIPNVRTRTFFMVRDHLDGEALQTALDTLVRQHWRKLGARIVRNRKSGLLEYHVPRVFANDYELFRWSTQEYNGPIDEAVFSLRAPTAEGVTILPPVEALDSVWRPASWPTQVKDDPPNSPMLYVHVSHYSDATVLAVNIPHVFADQMGKTSFVKAWLGILDGRTPPPLIDDGLPHEKTLEDYAPHERRRPGKQHVRYLMEYFLVVLLGFLPGLIRYPKEEYSTLFFPRAVIQKLRARASKELEKKYGVDPGLSEGDIITAIMTKFSRLDKTGSRMMTLSQTVNLRGRVSGLMTAAEKERFLHNAIVSASSRFQITPDTPISEIAYFNRKAIEDLLAPGGPDLALAVAREIARLKQSMHICEVMDTSYAVTSWSTIWKGLDFSSALAKQEKEGDGQVPMKTPELMVFGMSGEPGKPRRFHTTVMFRGDEGYWCDASFTPPTDAAVKAYLAQDPTLDKF